MLYVIKLHALMGLLSFAFVLGRSFLSFQNKPHLANHKVAILGTLGSMGLLLLTAFILCINIGQYPFADAWLTEKLAFLFVYVGLGLVALSPKLSVPIRAMLLTLCGAVFGVIFTVAKHHTPLLFS